MTVPAQPVSTQAQVTTTQSASEPSVNTNSRRYACFVEAHDLRRQGFTVSAIARQTGMDRKPVRNHLAWTTLPAFRRQRRRFSKLLPYQAYLLDHWQNGRRTVRQLWLDIRELGFTGSHSVVATFMAQLRKERGLPPYLRTELQCPVASPVLSPQRG